MNEERRQLVEMTQKADQKLGLLRDRLVNDDDFIAGSGGVLCQEALAELRSSGVYDSFDSTARHIGWLTMALWACQHLVEQIENEENTR